MHEGGGLEAKDCLRGLSPASDPVDKHGSLTSAELKTIDEIPSEGGVRGWMTVAGSWLVLFSSMGYIYSFGVYQDYYTRVFLTSSSPSKIAWMGSVQLALPFAEGIVAGKLFDAGHIRTVMIFGSTIFTFCLFMLSLAHEEQYYQVFLSQGLGMGIGAGCLFTPANAIVSRHFRKHRGLAYGIALSGISTGAVAFPIILNHAIPRFGFGSGVRVTAYIVLGFLAVGNILIQTPPQLPGKKSPPPDVKQFFKDPAYLALLFGSLLALLGVYFPVIYLQLYSVQHRVSDKLAFYSLAIINGSGTVGRIAGNHLADTYGIWNIQIPSILATGATIWAILGINNAVSLVVVSVLYGIASGAWLSLTMAGLPSLATSPNEIGARVGVALAVVSPGILGSAPLQGALLTRNFAWIRPVAFSGTISIFAGTLYLITRSHVAMRKGTQRV
ncbi:hypothetical protein AX17_004249 [Amanita inopinata Kibby_2008]|nr:hypothetical protein AX17_004249 [Amanita inopinata Kibby_2008]